MNLEYIVGSIIIEGKTQPFVMRTQTGKFEVGDYAKPDDAQQNLSVIQQQRFVQLIAERAGISYAQVRLGQYHCSECGQWVEATPQQWSISICMSCSLDRGTELHERYTEEEQAVSEAAKVAPVVEEEPTEALATPVAPDEEPAEEEEEVVAAAPTPALEEAVLEEATPEEVVPEEVVPELEVPEDAFIDVVLLPDEGVMLETAIRLAVEAHSGQQDKSGAPYILHPLRLMLTMDTPAERMAAVLHDVVEDTAWTLEALRREGFSEEVVEAVACLTRQEGESYDAFIERAAQHPIARRVKLADLEDNMDVRRLHDLTKKDQSRLARYLKAWRRLKEVGP